MSFKQNHSKHTDWRGFCQKHESLLIELPSIALALTNPDRFEELLERGSIKLGEETQDILGLSDLEFRALQEFVSRFKVDWQSWFVASLYPAYFRECERRGYDASE